MLKAFDTILQSEVSAELAALNGGFEPYRYECACCGEEVFVAAPYSTRMVTHFRHRSGNNDIECENYLGQFGAINTDSRSRKSNRERVEFYYENNSKTFNVGLRFSESEIQSYEQQDIDFELRTKDSDTPFRILKINRANFTPDVPTLIPLNNFSSNYYLSNTLNETKRKYVFFNRDNAPIFFKVQGNDKDFKAKLVRSMVLFTNTQYFVALQNTNSTQRKVQFPSEIEIWQTFSFETMYRKFSGLVLSITNKTASLDHLFKQWGYQLEESEALTLLWPPAKEIDDVSIISSDYAYIYSSFELQAHGNINVHSKDIFKISPNISKVSIKPTTKIFKKNAEIVIDKFVPSVDVYTELTPFKRLENIFTTPDDGLYFLFNRSGGTLLKSGQSVVLTPFSLIVKYEHNYPIGYIYPSSQKELSGEELLIDVLAHYKRTEILDPARFSSGTISNTAATYITKCGITGLINFVAKQFIEEGRI